MQKIKQLLFDSSAATMVEYAVMLALIALVSIAAITLVGFESANFWGNSAGEIDQVLR